MQHESRVIKTSLNGHIGRITLANTDKFNALSQAAWLAIPNALDELVSSDARVIVLTGEGENFCAGADISEFDVVRKDAATAAIYEKANADAFAAVRDTPIPVVAAIRGFCLGGGFGLAAATDIRIAVENAKFGVPAARLGLGYPVDAMADIVNAVGAQNAKRLLFTAERFDSVAMQDMGFLSEVLEADRLDERVQDLAQIITQLAPLTHRATKASIAAALGGSVAEAERLGAKTFSSDDYAEGRKAFQERRKPEFKGS